MDQQPQRSWLGRNWKWLVPVGCLGTLVLCAGFCTGIVGIAFASLRSSWACTEGAELARRNPAVRAELGEPIEVGWIITGEVHNRGPSGEGNARLAIPLAGPKKSGVLHVVALRERGQWRFTEAQLFLDGGAKITLIKKSD